MCDTGRWVGAVGIVIGAIGVVVGKNVQDAVQADEGVESAVELFLMRVERRGDYIFCAILCAILWISALDCSFHQVFDEREKAVEDDALWVGIMVSRYEVT